MKNEMIELLKTLPPVVACVVWDIVNANITLETIKLADNVTPEEWEMYEVVRCIAAGNPEYPPFQEARIFVDMMLEELVLQSA